MTVCVHGPEDEMMWLGVTPAFTVLQLMDMVDRILGIPPAEQWLTCKLKFLNPGQTLGECDVQDNDSIIVRLRRHVENAKGEGKGSAAPTPVIGLLLDTDTGRMRWQGPVSILIRTLIDTNAPLAKRVAAYCAFGDKLRQTDPTLYPAFEDGLFGIVAFGEDAVGSREMQLLDEHLIAMMHSIETGQLRGSQG